MRNNTITFTYVDGVVVELCSGSTVPGIRHVTNRHELPDVLKFMGLQQPVDESIIRINVPFTVEIDGIHFMSVSGIVGYETVEEKSDENIYLTLELPYGNSVVLNNVVYVTSFGEANKLEDMYIEKNNMTYFMKRKSYCYGTMGKKRELIKMTYFIEPNEDVDSALNNIVKFMETTDILTLSKRDVSCKVEDEIKNRLTVLKQQFVEDERFKVQLDNGVCRSIYAMNNKLVLQGIDLICTVLAKDIDTKIFQEEC